MRKHNIKDLIEQEKLLYLEVEQLRYRLYLHDASLIFGFFSAFYFAYQDIKKLFVKNVSNNPDIKTKELSIASLRKKSKSLTMLSHTPYAWVIYLARKIKYSIPRRIEHDPRNSIEVGKDPHETLLIFGSTNGTDLQSRSVQIAQNLSENNKVIYVEGVFDEGNKSGFRIVKNSENFLIVRLIAHKSLHLNYQQPIPKEIIFIKKSLHLFKLKTLKLSHFQIYIHHPFWGSILPIKKNSFIFDHSDNFAKISNTAKHIIHLEKLLVKNASKITAPHAQLLRNKKDVVIKNGVDWEQFKDTSKMIQTCDVGLCWIKKPVIGYIGVLDEKIDEVLLGKLASAFPTASIVLVGNTDYRPIIEVAEKYLNIFPVGIQPYKKLPLFLQSFDIIISPLKPFAQGVADHPELPLYLASGKPILATASVNRGQSLYSKQYIYFQKNHTEWVLAIDEALKEKKRSKKKYLRIAAAKKLSWRVHM
ncbi:MAG: hypothetical protein NTZ55_02215 [Candidatus Roizmanbacteria bacterium]|nr:hypothetical protein [Candidatus Roizmanbacteria bacterium]